MKSYLISIKWKYLRWVVKRRTVSFRKFMVRMYHLQELRKLEKYDIDNKLSYWGYSRIRKIYIKEFTDGYLHDPYNDKNIIYEKCTSQTN